MNFLTPSEIQDFKNQLRKNPDQAANILNTALNQGDFLVDYDVISFLEDIIRQAAQPGASLLLQNLNKLKTSQGQSSNYLYGKLVGMLLDYFPQNTEVIKHILAWNPDLISENAILKNACIKSDQDVDFYRQVIGGGIQTTNVRNFEVADFVLHLFIQSPGFEESVLDTLNQVQTGINLNKVIQYIIENKRGLDALYNKLDVVGRVDSGSYAIAEYLMRAFGERRVSAFFKYVKNSSRISYLNKEIEILASQITPAEYPHFLSEMDSFWTKQFYPENIVLALILNPNLHPNIVINSKISVRLYKSILDQIRYFHDAFRANQHKLNYLDLLHFMAVDPIFQSLDKNFHSEIVRSTRDLQPSDKLNQLKIKLLIQIDFQEDVFNTEFFDSLLNFYIQSQTAIFLLGKIAQHGCYPFYNFDFMVYLLTAADELYFKKYIMGAIMPLFPKEYDLEKVFLKLSQINPHDFAFIYIKNKRKLARMFSKYNKTAMQIQVNCWRQLGFWKRIRCMLPF